MNNSRAVVPAWIGRAGVFLPFGLLIGAVALLESVSLLIGGGDSDAAFAGHAPRDAMQLTIPEAGSLPYGLAISTHDFQPQYRERALFVGDDALIVEVRLFTPIDTNVADEPAYDHVIDASFGPVYWLAVPPGDGPRAAKWIGNRYGYTISVLSAASWEASDLVRFAEALVEAQQ